MPRCPLFLLQGTIAEAAELGGFTTAYRLGVTQVIVNQRVPQFEARLALVVQGQVPTGHTGFTSDRTLPELNLLCCTGET